ncbi:MAG: Gfo/Idh/MocA family oxidoreductase [Acidimicrobiaceae bacterium]|nr:Gfo/Idh/MocA family oxidoreductase [Acidimicrobiaceae bacterium]
MTRLAIIGAGKSAVLHGESARAIRGIKLVGVGGRSSGRAGAVAAALGCEELAVDDMVRRADMLVVAVPPGDIGEVLARIPLDRPLIVESPVAMPSAVDTAERHATHRLTANRPRAMLGANLLHAQVVRDGLAAINSLTDAHHLVLRANGVRPVWHSASADESGVTLDLGARLLPVLLAAAGKPVVEVSAELRRQDGFVVAAELGLRLQDGRLARAEFHWGDEPPAAEVEAAGATRVVSVGLWPFPVLEVDGNETASAEGREPLHALGFVSQMQRLKAVTEQQAEPWPGLAGGVGALRVIEAANLSDSSRKPALLV